MRILITILALALLGACAIKSSYKNREGEEFTFESTQRNICPVEGCVKERVNGDVSIGN